LNQSTIDTVYSRLPAKLFLWAVLITFVIWSRWAALFIAPSFDDWIWLLPVRELVHEHGILIGLQKSFLISHGAFWRPLHGIPIAWLYHDRLVFPQVLKLLAIIGLLPLCAAAARRSGLSSAESYLTALALGVHQAMVLGDEADRWGDLVVTTCALAMYLQSLRRQSKEITGREYMVWAGFLTTVSLMGKEAGVALPMIPVGFAILVATKGDNGSRRDHIRAAIASVAVIVTYLAWRHYLNVPLRAEGGDGYYSLAFGTNVLQRILKTSEENQDAGEV
jgi:hypothetical protein